MRRNAMNLLSMPRIVICLVLIACNTLTHAQTKASAQARAAAEATAQVQAQAIAQAAASLQSQSRAPAKPTMVPAAVPPVPVIVPAYPAPVALPAQPVRSPAGPTLGQSTAPAVPAVTSAPGPAHAATDLASEQMAISERVHQGQLPCELGATVRVEADAARPGYFHVLGKGFRYHMHPVRTSTGAIRLEDAKAGAVWLQLANKSMLMDQTKGRRVADECAHPDQVAYAKGMKTNPPPSLFDTTGMGRPKN
jgi:hypothetical protein